MSAVLLLFPVEERMAQQSVRLHALVGILFHEVLNEVLGCGAHTCWIVNSVLVDLPLKQLLR